MVEEFAVSFRKLAGTETWLIKDFSDFPFDKFKLSLLLFVLIGRFSISIAFLVIFYVLTTLALLNRLILYPISRMCSIKDDVSFIFNYFNFSVCLTNIWDSTFCTSNLAYSFDTVLWFTNIPVQRSFTKHCRKIRTTVTYNKTSRTLDGKRLPHIQRPTLYTNRRSTNGFASVI